MNNIQQRILEELSYTNLANDELAKRLGISITKLKPDLHELVEKKKVREAKRQEEKVWEAI